MGEIEVISLEVDLGWRRDPKRVGSEEKCKKSRMIKDETFSLHSGICKFYKIPDIIHELIYQLKIAGTEKFNFFSVDT